MSTRNRAARILPDSRTFAYTVITGVFIIFAAACAISFQGQAEVAGTYMGLTGWTRYLVPIVIDASLLVYAAAALVRRARGESVRWVIAASGAWVLISIGANVVHAIQPSGILVGATLAALMPISILMSSVVAESLLVAPPETGFKLDREAILSAELVASQATVAASVAETDQLRKRIAKLEEDAMGTAPAASSHSKAAKALAAVPVLTAAKAEREAQVLALRGDGVTVHAISEQLNTSVSTVKRIIASSAATAAA